MKKILIALIFLGACDSPPQEGLAARKKLLQSDTTEIAVTKPSDDYPIIIDTTVIGNNGSKMMVAITFKVENGKVMNKKISITEK